MARVLDLDLDFFVNPATHFVSGNRRLAEEHYTSASIEAVERFLEERCGLSQTRRIPGRFCEEHVAAFDIWREWIDAGTITNPFEVVHVDAHADMGLGDPSWTYLLSDILALPVSHRSDPKRGWEGLNSGSYLAFAIANRWLSSLQYVFPAHAANIDGYPTDVHTVFFRDEDWVHGPIELPHYSQAQLDELLMLTRNPPEPLCWEPPIPNKYTTGENFYSEGFTHMILAQSRGFTPASADALIPVIRSYFDHA
jgi:hypothetical protein